ncbi:phosphoglucomutase [Geomicrobium halophilum]|uniref:Phosphoglucomutase n=2 Tax=Geomicrobium halophilum TaxID=549000 RepID=A0A841PLD9_9BACL|nr:phosphoglucomutase [Geomicrobium halophilum]
MQTIIERWRKGLENDPELSAQLEEMMINHQAELEDSFYRSLTFGTGGMRGELGPGPNRMNRYTVRKAALGLGHYLKEVGDSGRVVIAYDSRRNSALFAKEAALTLTNVGIEVDVFPSLRPTPVLSFAVREQGASAGVMITASHNPAIYNGLKVYDRYGAQLPPGPAEELISYVEAIEDELTIPIADEGDVEEKGLFHWLSSDIDERYQRKLRTILHQPVMGNENGEQLKIVFSPLHGTASAPLYEAFRLNGYTHVHIVPEQAHPDPDFSTVSKPNPEEAEAFEMAMQAGREQGADLLIATDPDADRLGIAIPDTSKEGGYRVLTGNETGFLLLHYVLTQLDDKDSLPVNGKVFKTIVTSESGRALAEHFGMDCIDTLTGFKFIAEKIKQLAEEGENESFLFGYEESYGYLLGSFVRDKDALQAALLVAEIALSEKRDGRTLTDTFTMLYEQFGYYQEGIESLTLKGRKGAEQIEALLTSFREQPPESFADGQAVTIIEDYQKHEAIFVESGERTALSLPASNVIKYKCADESWVCVRPSGTEPKMKCYFGVKELDSEAADQALFRLQESVMDEIQARLQLTEAGAQKS